MCAFPNNGGAGKNDTKSPLKKFHIWTQKPIFRFLALLASLIVGILGVTDYIFSYKVWKVITGPKHIKISCPPITRDYRAIISGSWEGNPLDTVILYVAPQDGTNKYWLQDPKQLDDKFFSYQIRLGNYCGFGHDKLGWPLRFKLFAFVLPKIVVPPGKGEASPFIKYITSVDLKKELYADYFAKADAKCTIERYQPCNMPTIIGFETPRECECELQKVHDRSLTLSWSENSVCENSVLRVKVFDKAGSIVVPEQDLHSGGSISIREPGDYNVRLSNGLENCEIDRWIRFDFQN